MNLYKGAHGDIGCALEQEMVQYAERQRPLQTKMCMRQGKLQPNWGIRIVSCFRARMTTLNTKKNTKRDL